jgi:hypothetical protein
MPRKLILFEKKKRRCLGAFQLVGRALLRGLVRSPPQELCTVSKATTGEMIVLHFDYELWGER